MYELDKAAFGHFLAQLRREKGMTQKELAATLYVSDKAVSKCGDALKLLMNDRDMSVENMESESGLSVSTVKRLRAGQEASAEQVVAISVALRLPPMVSSDLLRMCGITLDFNNQRNTVYQMILTGHYKDGIEKVNVYLAACGCAPLKTAC